MKMNTGKKYCPHYRNLVKRQEIFKRVNDRWGYKKYELPKDNNNCDHCDRYPALMPMKICFRLRFRWRLYNFVLKLVRFPWRINVKVIDTEKKVRKVFLLF